MTQRETQTARYWQQFSLTSDDVEFLFKMLVESSQPHSTQDLAVALIEHRCQQEEVAMRADIKDGIIYQPQGSFRDGDELVFPRFQYAAGKVVGQRTGHNPQYGDFTVIQVEFEEPVGTREFAADFAHAHPLNLGDGQALAEAEGIASPAELATLYGNLVVPKLEAGLQKQEDFLFFRDQWFLKDMSVAIHAGHLNIAEAAIDIQDQPLSAVALLKDFDDLPAGASEALKELSLNAVLQADERFVNVGPVGEVRWYLRRLQPPELGKIPEPLRLPHFNYDVKFLDNEMRQLLREIDDEAIDPDLQAPGYPDANQVTIVLNQPHRRTGTVPVLNKTAHLFPDADEDFVRIDFIDKATGDRIPGWVVSKYGYVVGLREWYKAQQLPVGAYITFERGEEPLSVIVSYEPVRPTRKWIRGAVAQRDHIGFQNVRQIIPCEFDDFMIIGIDDDEAINALTLKPDDKRPLVATLRQVTMELVKISPQGNVHAKTLYSALNVVRRCPPLPMFYELASNASFVPMGNGYWAYDTSRDR